MQRFTVIGALCALSTAGACASARHAGPRDAPPRVDHVVAYWLRLDTLAAARDVGAVIVAVRNADRPEEVVAAAAVHLDSSRVGTTGSDGVVRFEGVPAGVHSLMVARIGFRRLRLRLRVALGCSERVEAYLPVNPICEGGCAVTQPRAVLTTCAPAR